jgi:hypothetical protein
VLDARPSALRRFGDLDQGAAERIDPLIEELADRLRRIRALAGAGTGGSAS